VTTRPLPRWARQVVYLAGGALFAAGAFLSGWSLTLLAEQCGIPRPFSVSLPLALDAGAAVGVTLWVAATGELQAAGRRTARLLFALSLAGNAVERISSYSQLPASWLPRPVLAAVAVGVAVVFPLLAYLMASLVLLVRNTQDVPVKPRGVARKTSPASVTSPAVATTSTTGVEEAVEFALGELSEGRTAGSKRLRRQFPGLTEHHAKTAARIAREQHERAMERAV